MAADTPLKRPPQLGRWLKQTPWLVLALWLAWLVVDWGVIKAVFSPDLAACQALAREGACWGVVAHKGPMWLLGRYPEAEHGRGWLALALWFAALAWLVGALTRVRWPGSWRAALPAGMLALAGGAVLAGGWSLGPWHLVAVESALWGGLPLTLLLCVGSLLASAPLALLLAWGRLSRTAWLRWPATAVIEVVRGAPLVMWLFMAAFVLPALWSAVLPAGWAPGPVARVWLVMTVFSAAYMAEIFRGSLRVVAHDQAEAATVLGAGWWTTQRQVILPQAMRGALPALVSHSIGLLKDTSLVMVVSLQDLTGAMSVSLNGDADWRPYFLEAYLFIALAYALMCLGVARMGRLLEQRHPALGQQQ